MKALKIWASFPHSPKLANSRGETLKQGFQVDNLCNNTFQHLLSTVQMEFPLQIAA
jgi:hypothetical protein